MKAQHSIAKHSTLQKDLLHAIRLLIKTEDHPQELKDIWNSVRAVKIPDDDYRDVLHLILLLLHFQPQIMGNRNDYALKQLCLRCIYAIE